MPRYRFIMKVGHVEIIINKLGSKSIKVVDKIHNLFCNFNVETQTIPRGVDNLQLQKRSYTFFSTEEKMEPNISLVLAWSCEWMSFFSLIYKSKH